MFFRERKEYHVNFRLEGLGVEKFTTFNRKDFRLWQYLKNHLDRFGVITITHADDETLHMATEHPVGSTLINLRLAIKRIEELENKIEQLERELVTQELLAYRDVENV